MIGLHSKRSGFTVSDLPRYVFRTMMFGKNEKTIFLSQFIHWGSVLLKYALKETSASSTWIVYVPVSNMQLIASTNPLEPFSNWIKTSVWEYFNALWSECMSNACTLRISIGEKRTTVSSSFFTWIISTFFHWYCCVLFIRRSPSKNSNPTNFGYPTDEFIGLCKIHNRSEYTV